MYRKNCPSVTSTNKDDYKQIFVDLVKKYEQTSFQSMKTHLLSLKNTDTDREGTSARIQINGYEENLKVTWGQLRERNIRPHLRKGITQNIANRCMYPTQQNSTFASSRSIYTIKFGKRGTRGSHEVDSFCVG